MPDQPPTQSHFRGENDRLRAEIRSLQADNERLRKALEGITPRGPTTWLRDFCDWCHSTLAAFSTKDPSQHDPDCAWVAARAALAATAP